MSARDRRATLVAEERPWSRSLDSDCCSCCRQLVGLLVTRLARRASWAAWPAAAIAVFGVVFYWWLWVPARNAAEACGNPMWQLVARARIRAAARPLCPSGRRRPVRSARARHPRRIETFLTISDQSGLIPGRARALA